MKKIEDPNLARAILGKVNAMNLDTATRCAVAAGIFAVLPQSTAAPLVGSALVLAGMFSENVEDNLSYCYAGCADTPSFFFL